MKENEATSLLWKNPSPILYIKLSMLLHSKFAMTKKILWVTISLLVNTDYTIENVHLSGDTSTNFPIIWAQFQELARQVIRIAQVARNQPTHLLI